ncbi:hypothetical protein NQ318_020278 [Aromia moschata]|uniref:[histone H3]-lysine(36) N-trimethyltransferase n=1 Tax=Aromia moschata TaxID=1265417 RepID=A0AAV8Z9S8_9CUCU|nr:hypothetical protein NQ318_020278 [Aromia moschata]
MDVDEKPKLPARDAVVEARLKQFIHLKENVYKTDRMTCKEAKKMTCDCFLTTEEVEADEYGCGEDCLNRLLLIECGGLCQVGDRCTNKRFQRGQFAPVEVFNTEKKGLGLRAAANIPYGEFILEYVGEVLNCEEFDKRAEVYSQDKNIHYYFMSLRADAIIDATVKGNISRFINHSCDPNAETQKWTVNGELRIGFFSTRTILAGEEITFDYRFQRYGKEAQKCYCEASICRGWLGDQPDEDSEDEDEEEDEEEEETEEVAPIEKVEPPTLVPVESEKLEDEQKPALVTDAVKDEAVKVEKETEKVAPATVTPKRKSPRKKPRKDIFEDLDQLDEEIEMLVTTGLKNQAHTLKLSRLMVRAKEPTQRAKLLRILRRGELPCRRLFLDYHGLRLMHGYMIDAQHLVRTSKKYESVRLEMLQTLAVLPIPNKTMLQDSKVLPTVENWATNKDVCSPQDSDSNSPKTEQDAEKCAEPRPKEPPTKPEDAKPNEGHPERSIEDQEGGDTLLEEWANLKEVFRIPKKERIEQMKEHEREANKKFMQSGYGGEQPGGRKSDRYRHLARHKSERDGGRKGAKGGEKPSAEFIRLSKIERRKLFALQHELKEEERRLKQREMWRQHEMNCMMIGTDPRFTAPFDPNRGYQYIWNPQIGQWQNYPLPPAESGPVPLPASHAHLHFHDQSDVQHQSAPAAQPEHAAPPDANPEEHPRLLYPNQMGLPQLPTSMGLSGPVQAAAPASVPQMHMQTMPTIPPLPQTTETESSSETSSVSSDSSSENSDSDDEIDDTKLLMEVRKQMEKTTKLTTVIPDHVKTEETSTPSPDDITFEDIDLDQEEELSLPPLPVAPSFVEDDVERPSIDIRLKEQFDLLKDDKPAKKKRRVGLCEEILISPRTEEDKQQFKEDMKRYKANKEKLRRQKELILQQTKKQMRELEAKKAKEKRARATLKSRIKEMPDFNSEAAKKIKENFRSNMASTVVGALNGYRKPDCKEGRITNTEDFKHLARKLTHFVMLKEMKHIAKIEDLTCTDNVKAKAREYIRKYMSKFGEVYIKRNDSPDFKD